MAGAPGGCGGMSDAADLSLDLDACAREPIRIPGGIQPHGALLVVEPGGLRMLQASANLEAVTGLAFAAGRPPELDEATRQDIAGWIARGDPTLLRQTTVLGRRLQLSAHRTAQGMILEFEEAPESEADTLEGLYPRLRRFMDLLPELDDLQALLDFAVGKVRSLTGFDRVTIYSFDARGDGTVLAEDGNGVLPSYLGLRFPASDIPAQARELYKLNRLRLISSSDYTPVPITPALSPVDGQPLDLGQAGLRSVSPVHLEYMRNMGTGASMSVSLLVDGDLWGLMSCHSAQPRRVSLQVRSACDFLGQMLSLRIGERERTAWAGRRVALKRIEAELLAAVAGAPTFQAGLGANGEAWLRLADATGAAVVTRESVVTAGETPGDAPLLELADWLKARGEEAVLATDSLPELWPQAEAFADVASGLLALPISQVHASYLMWFRPEVVRTVTWAGEPQKPAASDDPGERLRPRTSFAQWKQQLRLRALPWAAAEVESAEEFGTAIVNYVLKRAEEKAELNDQLERTNKELESFSYSISHDLRAPFRHIVGFAELLRDREKGLDEKSRHYLETIVDAALQAGRLVDDLLHFSQLGRANLAKGRVDMRKLVEEIRRSLELQTEGRQVEWRVGALPPAWGDAALLRQAMTNLIGNAVKYSRDRAPATIEIDGDARGGEAVYTVRDNGVGFDMRYADKLFGVFQRLHRAEEFEGTGIGLALTKRVINRHGGWITAHSVLGEGATFTLGIPDRSPEDVVG